MQLHLPLTKQSWLPPSFVALKLLKFRSVYGNGDDSETSSRAATSAPRRTPLIFEKGLTKTQLLVGGIGKSSFGAAVPGVKRLLSTSGVPSKYSLRRNQICLPAGVPSGGTGQSGKTELG